MVPSNLLFPSVFQPQVASGTWAARPTSPQQGALYFATDLGSGFLLVYDGSKWKPLGGTGTLYNSSQAIVDTGNTTSTIMNSVKIPASLLSANGTLLVDTTWSTTNNANSKSMGIYLSPLSGGLTGAFLFAGWTFNSAGGIRLLNRVSNANSLSSQIGTPVNSNGVGTFTPATGSVNTANDSWLQFVGTLTVGTDNVTLSSYTVQWIEQ